MILPALLGRFDPLAVPCRGRAIGQSGGKNAYFELLARFLVEFPDTPVGIFGKNLIPIRGIFWPTIQPDFRLIAPTHVDPSFFFVARVAQTLAIGLHIFAAVGEGNDVIDLSGHTFAFDAQWICPKVSISYLF